MKNDIKSFKTSDESKVYSNMASLSMDEAVALLPESMKVFLSGIITGKDTSTKLASLGQALMQAARPRAVTLPLQLDLGVQMHRHFGSRFLNETLYRMGFASSYEEIKRFESSAATTNGVNIPSIPENSFLQFSADNVDHNTRTLDGLNTFHGMGMMAMITPAISYKKTIPKVKRSEDEIASTGHVKIHHYNTKPDPAKLSYKALSTFLQQTHDNADRLDIVHSSSLLFKTPRPSWSGMMQAVFNGEHPANSSTVLLPMIDMDPSNMTCIYSTLKYISLQARQQQVTPVLTLDQPLYFKALMIIENVPQNSDTKNFVLRLGGLHIEMSFLGAIGNVMAGSGLKEKNCSK